MLVARRDQLMRLEVEFGTDPGRQWRLETDPSATTVHQQQRARWLKPAA
jgi:hypothetical protein